MSYRNSDGEALAGCLVLAGGLAGLVAGSYGGYEIVQGAVEDPSVLAYGVGIVGGGLAGAVAGKIAVPLTVAAGIFTVAIPLKVLGIPFEIANKAKSGRSRKAMMDSFEQEDTYKRVNYKLNRTLSDYVVETISEYPGNITKKVMSRSGDVLVHYEAGEGISLESQIDYSDREKSLSWLQKRAGKKIASQLGLEFTVDDVILGKYVFRSTMEFGSDSELEETAFAIYKADEMFAMYLDGKHKGKLSNEELAEFNTAMDSRAYLKQ